MIHISTILLLLFAHWIADFVFQAERWALNKRKSDIALTSHVICYTFVFVAMTHSLFDNTEKLIQWTLLTFMLHGAVDFFTSRWVGNKFDKKHLGSEIPNFGAFTAIGLDQFIHYLCIFGTYILLTQWNTN